MYGKKKGGEEEKWSVNKGKEKNEERGRGRISVEREIKRLRKEQKEEKSSKGNEDGREVNK